MACRLLGSKPSSEPMPKYCWLDPEEQTSMKFQLEFRHIHWINAFETVVLENGVHLSRSQCVNSPAARPAHIRDTNWSSLYLLISSTYRYKTMGRNAADYASSHGSCKITWAICVKFLSNQNAVRKFAKSRKISQYFKWWDDRLTTIHNACWGERRGWVGWGGVWVGWGWNWKVGGDWGWGRVSVCCKLEIWA